MIATIGVWCAWFLAVLGVLVHGAKVISSKEVPLRWVDALFFFVSVLGVYGIGSLMGYWP